MKSRINAFLFFCLLGTALPAQDSLMVRRIFDAALTKGSCYENLRSLCKGVGHRLSGSPSAAKAVDWAYARFNGMALDRVEKQPCLVTHWERGKAESAWIKSRSGKLKVPVLALGSSIATSKGGIDAPVIEVFSLEEVKALDPAVVKGKIVFYNRPMNPTDINTFTAYGGCVDQRGYGAVEAARKGALAVVVRSMNLRLDDYPHTGNMRYEDGVTKIPACAISTNGAEALHRLLRDDPSLSFHLEMGCKAFPDAPSYNVMGELKGSTYPDQVIVVGGHLDSWDVGEGAHDDGAGVVQSIEVLHLFQTIGYKPRYTIRAVAFMNEENGMKGALAYADSAAKKGERHYAALESDEGGFSPRGFNIDASDETLRFMRTYADLLAPYLLRQIEKGYGGVDIGPLRKQGTALFGYAPDTQRYFDFHHAATDVFEGVNKRELELGAASMAVLIYLIDQHGLPENPQVPPTGQ
jgi:carboxypeptidase Q